MLSSRRFPAAALLLAFAACARPSPQASPSPPPAARKALPHAASSPSAPPSPAAAAAPRAATAATATPRPKPTPVRLPPDAPPRILAVEIDPVVHPGQHVAGRVRTTSNVASVECRIGGYGIVMHKTGVGTFALDYSVAGALFFVRGTYPMRIIARNAAGVSTERTIQLTIQ